MTAQRIETDLSKPARGYYFHYKRDLNGSLGNYAYYVAGINLDIETGEYSVSYLPLYPEARTYQEGQKHGTIVFDSRPLEMFLSEANMGEVKVARFRRVFDAAIVAQLHMIKLQMYPIL